MISKPSGGAGPPSWTIAKGSSGVPKGALKEPQGILNSISFFGEHVDQLKIRSSDEETKNWSKIKIAAKKKKKNGSRRAKRVFQVMDKKVVKL